MAEVVSTLPAALALKVEMTCSYLQAFSELHGFTTQYIILFVATTVRTRQVHTLVRAEYGDPKGSPNTST
jgi:hypothetical protein